LRHTSIRYTVPTRQLLECAVEATRAASYDAAPVIQFVEALRAKHSRLMQDPKRYLQEQSPTLHHFLLVAARAFYVLEFLLYTDVRSIYVRYSCSCHRFRRNSGYCKHSIAQTVQDGLVRIPPELDLKTIGSLPKRGRKRKLLTNRTYLRTLSDTARFTPIAGRSKRQMNGSDDDGDGSEVEEDKGDSEVEEDEYYEMGEDAM
jgi:hypothetical protein